MQNIDQIFQDRLQQSAVTPPPFVWDGIEAELRRRRRRRFFWWISTGVSALTLAGLLYISLSPAAPEHQSANLTATTPVATTPVASPNRSNPVTAPTVHQSGAVSPISNIPVTKPAFSATNSSDIHRTTTKSITAAAAMQAPAAVALPIPVDMPAATIANTKANNIPATTATSLNSTSIGAVAEPSASAGAPAFALKNTAAALSLRPLEPRSKTSQPPLSNWVTVSKPNLRHAMTRKRKEPNKHCYDFAEHGNAWLFDAYAGPSFTRKTLTAPTAEWASFRDKRNQTEQNSFAFNGGLRATFVFREQFLLRAGVHYDQFTEVFEYVDPTSIQYIISQIYDPVSNSWQIDTIDINYGEAYTKTYNRFGLLDVPVELGYELRSGRTGVSINAGLSANVLFWKRGAILNTAGDAAFFTPGKNNEQQVFRTRTGLSAQASAQWFWHYTPRTRFFAEPYYRRILHPVTLSSYPIQQRYGTFGIKMGVTRIF